jgi:hypothetical protein
MRRLSPALALCVLLASRAVGAQTAEYVPAHQLPQGRELVAIYVGATDCRPCHSPEVKKAVIAMKALVAAQAKQRGMAFSAIGVATDWDLNSGVAFLAPLGYFDQLVIGANWTNLAIERFVLSDSVAEMSMPQILLVERTVKVGKRITVSEPRFIRQVSGSEAIPAWVAAGAPIDVVDDKKLH